MFCHWRPGENGSRKGCHSWPTSQEQTPSIWSIKQRIIGTFKSIIFYHVVFVSSLELLGWPLLRIYGQYGYNMIQPARSHSSTAPFTDRAFGDRWQWAGCFELDCFGRLRVISGPFLPVWRRGGQALDDQKVPGISRDPKAYQVRRCWIRPGQLGLGLAFRMKQNPVVRNLDFDPPSPSMPQETHTQETHSS